MTTVAIAACAVCAAFILYIIAGYPLLLRFLARRPRTLHRAAPSNSVSVVIAVHNGEQYLERKLESVLAVNYPRKLVDIIVVSDGSTDATESIAERFASEGVTLIRAPRGGKCAALNIGMQYARGELLVFTDVRQPIAPDSFERLLAPFADPTVGVVSGDLVINDGRRADENDTGLYWRYEKWIRKHLSAIDSMFGATGAFYAIRRSLARPFRNSMLLDDVYLPLHAFFQGYRLVLEPGAVAFDEPTQRGDEFKRKVRTLAGNYQILSEYPQLLTPANRMWMHFVSYKFGRLMLPWLFAAFLVASFFLPERWRMVSLALQAAFYGAAMCDAFVPERFALKRVTSPICTFVVLMIAAAMALKILFVAPHTLWKQTRRAAQAH